MLTASVAIKDKKGEKEQWRNRSWIPLHSAQVRSENRKDGERDSMSFLGFVLSHFDIDYPSGECEGSQSSHSGCSCSPWLRDVLKRD